jgi:hypothetical protein
MKPTVAPVASRNFAWLNYFKLLKMHKFSYNPFPHNQKPRTPNKHKNYHRGNCQSWRAVQSFSAVSSTHLIFVLLLAGLA